MNIQEVSDHERLVGNSSLSDGEEWPVIGSGKGSYQL
jgi:hypothetical protein